MCSSSLQRGTAAHSPLKSPPPKSAGGVDGERVGLVVAASVRTRRRRAAAQAERGGDEDG